MNSERCLVSKVSVTWQPVSHYAVHSSLNSLSHTHTDTQYSYCIIHTELLLRLIQNYHKRFQWNTHIGFSLLREVRDRPRWTCVAGGLLRAAFSLVEGKFTVLSSPHILPMTVILALPSVRPQQLDSKTIAHKNTFCSHFPLSHPSVTLFLSFSYVSLSHLTPHINYAMAQSLESTHKLIGTVQW